MLNKPLREEQADMKSRWSDPSYRWANDSALRRRYTKETNANATRLPLKRLDTTWKQFCAAEVARLNKLRKQKEKLSK